VVVLDTNVLSELMRPQPTAAGFARAAAQPHDELYTTSANKAEILFGIAALPDGRRRAALAAAADAMFNNDFAGRVLPLSGQFLGNIAAGRTWRPVISSSPAAARTCCPR
jgi:toxin FitB